MDRERGKRSRQTDRQTDGQTDGKIRGRQREGGKQTEQLGADSEREEERLTQSGSR